MKRKLVLIFGMISFFLCFYQESVNARIAADKFNDFDGDGKTDFRVRRYSNGGDFRNYDWYILRSSDGSYSTTRWGMVNLQPPIQDDLPVSGDFDGDGKTDIAVWRQGFANPAVPTYFYILRSSDSTFVAQQFGLTSDLPICQDYDGDGKTDMAVYRPGNGDGMTWYMLQSRAGFQSVTLRNCCTALPGDFDGDGRGDFAVRYTEGNTMISKYYVVHSRQKKAKFVTFGNNNDADVPGDYDGDGKTDPAIMRRGTDGLKYFIVQGSQRGLFTVQWGLDTDSP